MPPKSKEKIVNGWLSRAAEDLRIAKYALTATPPFLSPSAFHCQQAAEKAMKGFLIAHDKATTKTHDLRALSRPILEIVPEMDKCLSRGATLTPYAVSARYPDAGDGNELSLEEVKKAIDIAEQIYSEIINRLR